MLSRAATIVPQAGQRGGRAKSMTARSGFTPALVPETAFLHKRRQCPLPKSSIAGAGGGATVGAGAGAAGGLTAAGFAAGAAAADDVTAAVALAPGITSFCPTMIVSLARLLARFKSAVLTP